MCRERFQYINPCLAWILLHFSCQIIFALREIVNSNWFGSTGWAFWKVFNCFQLLRHFLTHGRWKCFWATFLNRWPSWMSLCTPWIIGLLMLLPYRQKNPLHTLAVTVQLTISPLSPSPGFFQSSLRSGLSVRLSSLSSVPVCLSCVWLQLPLHPFCISFCITAACTFWLYFSQGSHCVTRSWGPPYKTCRDFQPKTFKHIFRARVKYACPWLIHFISNRDSKELVEGAYPSVVWS